MINLNMFNSLAQIAWNMHQAKATDLVLEDVEEMKRDDEGVEDKNLPVLPPLSLDCTGKFTAVSDATNSTSLKYIASKLNALLNSDVYAFVQANPLVMTNIWSSNLKLFEQFNKAIKLLNDEIDQHNQWYAQRYPVNRLFLTVIGMGVINKIERKVDHATVNHNMWKSLQGIKIIEPKSKPLESEDPKSYDEKSSLKVVAQKLSAWLKQFLEQRQLVKFGEQVDADDRKILSRIILVNSKIDDHNEAYAKCYLLTRLFLTFIRRGKIRPIDNPYVTEKCNFGRAKHTLSGWSENRFLVIDEYGNCSTTADANARSSLKVIAYQLSNLLKSDLADFCKTVAADHRRPIMRSKYRALLRRIILVNSKIDDHNKAYAKCYLVTRLFLTLIGRGKITPIDRPSKIVAKRFIKTKAIKFAKLTLQLKMKAQIEEILTLEDKLVSTSSLQKRCDMLQEDMKMYKKLIELDERAVKMGCASMLSDSVSKRDDAVVLVAEPVVVSAGSADLVPSATGQVPPPAPLPPSLLTEQLAAMMRRIDVNTTQLARDIQQSPSAAALQHSGGSSSSLSEESQKPQGLIHALQQRLADINNAEKKAARKAQEEERRKELEAEESPPPGLLSTLQSALARFRPVVEAVEEDNTGITEDDWD